MRKFLHPEERHWYDQSVGFFTTRHPGAGDFGLANLLWSAKESMFKWYGAGGVDFSEQIRLDGFTESGIQAGRFLRDGVHPLSVNYRYFGDLCLSWVHGDYTG
jgi:4'-phosphopantetheinyl transferase EntD